MKRTDFRYREALRVRWAEVDAQQIVFNAHYLMYIDTAMAGWWRALALPYPAAVVQLGGDLYVRKATLEYEAAARCDERLTVGIRCTSIGRSSMRFQAAVFRGEQRLVLGELVYVYADPATMRSQPVPASLRAAFESYEAGEPMLQIRSGDWGTLGAAVRSLRETCAGDGDAGVLHAVAFNRFDAAVACGRLRVDGDVARISGRCTLAALRGAGHGGALLLALQRAGLERGCRSSEVEGAVLPISPAPGAPPGSAPGDAAPGTSG